MYYGKKTCIWQQSHRFSSQLDCCLHKYDDPELVLSRENFENAELAEVKQKNEMQQEIILKLTEQIQLLRNSANQVRFKISWERCFLE